MFLATRRVARHRSLGKTAADRFAPVLFSNYSNGPARGDKVSDEDSDEGNLWSACQSLTPESDGSGSGSAAGRRARRVRGPGRRKLLSEGARCPGKGRRG